MDAAGDLAGLHLFTNRQRLDSGVIHYCPTGALAFLVHPGWGDG